MQTSINQIQIHYALQTCDVKSYQGQKRYASDDRTLISKKCIKSFLESVQYCSEQNRDVSHNIAIIDDHSSKELKEFINQCSEKFSSDKIQIEIIELTSETGIRKSIEHCYHWLQRNGKDLVYQIQDDYLFTQSAISDVIDVFYQLYHETKTHAIISPYNDPNSWLTQYRNIVTPRTVIVGKHGYWIQYYDMSCSFLTSHEQFSQHWDLYHCFLDLIDKHKTRELENVSLNYMLTKRGVLGLIPINSLALHLQSDLEKDPHINWEILWNSINLLD